MQNWYKFAASTLARVAFMGSITVRTFKRTTFALLGRDAMGCASWASARRALRRSLWQHYSDLSPNELSRIGHQTNSHLARLGRRLRDHFELPDCLFAEQQRDARADRHDDSDRPKEYRGGSDVRLQQKRC